MKKSRLLSTVPLRPMPIRFWLELALSIVTTAALLLTLFRPAWIELLFGVDPDRSSGSAEFLIVTCLALTTLTLSSLAVRTWKSAQA